MGNRVRGRLAVLVAVLVGTGALIALGPPAAGAAPPCPQGKVCTDNNGFYELAVPPLPDEGIYGAYRDCVWHVHVDFGDGSSADYIFEGEVGLSGSHTFPHYGEYAVVITLSDSHHKANPTGAECLNPPQHATVLYRDPSKFAEEEQSEAAAKAAAEQREREERQAAKEKREREAQEAAKKRQEKEAREKKREGERGSTAPSTGSGSEEGGKGGGGFWTTCRRAIYAHKVPCAKAQRVIAHAGKRLTRRGSTKVSGFSCRFDPDRSRPLGCRRGPSRILGPPRAA